MTVKLRDVEVAPDGTEGRSERRRATKRERNKALLRGLSLLLAFAGAGLVLFFVGDLTTERGVFEALVGPEMPVVAPPLSPEPAGFDAEALGERLEEIAGKHQGIYGAVVLGPTSGAEAALRGDEKFMGASIGKLPAFVALYQAAARGELDLEEKITLLPDDIQSYGSGSLQAFPVGYSLSLRECAYRLVNNSDNTAWAMLDRRLGEDRVGTVLKDIGAGNSSYSGHLYPYYTTPNDVLLLLQKISDPQFTNEQLSDEMLDAMTNTTFEDRIPEKLPSGVRVAHKIGSYGDNFSDAGVVFYKDSAGIEKHYYLVVLAEDTWEDEARDAIQDMSLTVYEALTGTGGDGG